MKSAPAPREGGSRKAAARRRQHGGGNSEAAALAAAARRRQLWRICNPTAPSIRTCSPKTYSALQMLILQRGRIANPSEPPKSDRAPGEATARRRQLGGGSTEAAARRRQLWRICNPTAPSIRTCSPKTYSALQMLILQRGRIANPSEPPIRAPKIRPSPRTDALSDLPLGKTDTICEINNACYANLFQYNLQCSMPTPASLKAGHTAFRFVSQIKARKCFAGREIISNFAPNKCTTGKNMLRTRQEYIDIIRNHADELQTRFGISSMRMFGSVARNEHHEGSDVDLYVTMPPRFYNHIAAAQYLEDLLGCSVDLIQEHANLRPLFRKQIEQDGIDIISPAIGS